MRLSKLLGIVACLIPLPRALADGAAHDAPILPPPGFTQDAAPAAPVASAVHVVPRATPRISALVRAFPDKPSGGSANDAPVLPPPSFASYLAAPTAASVVVEIVPPRVTSIPALVDAQPVEPIENVAAEPVMSTPVVLPELSPKVIATEAACLTAVCSPCQGYPSCGDRAPCPQFWFAGAEATFLGVHVDSGGQTTVSYNDATFAGTELSLSGGSGHDGLSVGPRVWLGCQLGPQWAICGGFWTLNDSSDDIPVVESPPANIDEFSAGENTQTELNTVDLEAIRSFASGAWTLDAALGVRHAELESSTELGVLADLNGTSEAGSLLSTNTNFYGTGLTGSLTARRPLGTCGAQLFARSRGSVLWGDAGASTSAFSFVSTSPGIVNPAFDEQGVEDNGTAWIGEVQLGLQWDVPVALLRANAGFRVVGEYQSWMVDADVSSGSGVFPAGGSITTFSNASTGAGRVDLYGLALAAGLSW